MEFRRFVAVGDSCTEGIDDPHPDGTGYRGWADMVAEHLASQLPGLRYANLAVRGRRLDQIHAEQVPTAVDLKPDLVSVFGGANDVLQASTWDAGRTVASLRAAVRAVHGQATVVMFTLPEMRWSPGGSRLRARIDVVNDAVLATAKEFGAIVVDVRDNPATGDRRYFAADRLHLGERGHQLLAAHVLSELGFDPPAAWLKPLPAPSPQARWAQFREDARWVRDYAVPVVYQAALNKLTGREPGDGFGPKRPELQPVGYFAQLNSAGTP